MRSLFGTSKPQSHFGSRSDAGGSASRAAAAAVPSLPRAPTCTLGSCGGSDAWARTVLRLTCLGCALAQSLGYAVLLILATWWLALTLVHRALGRGDGRTSSSRALGAAAAGWGWAARCILFVAKLVCFSYNICLQTLITPL
jgi:hypothetical protein